METSAAWLRVLLSFIVASSVNAKYYSGNHRSCGRNDVIRVDELKVSPHPVTMPGEVKVTGALTLLQPFNGTIHAQLKVKHIIERAFDFYDICKLLSRECLRLQPLGLPCKCPVQNGTYSVTNYHVTIPKPNILKRFGFLEHVMYGAWDATIRLIDGVTKEEIFCYKIPDFELAPKVTLLEKIFSWFG